ncbi:MAG: AAA family ATPase [Candidatus ainarchaeum sp.]|nr:AAA family ATPase [Candidatus ainarchaeum sp.]
MTKLIKLVLKNFKSFKKAEIPISSGFTAIVGSNGSGKSNVLDALLFVLGITSLKTLRATKLTDLVNNTAKENYAKVDLILKNDGKTFEVSRMIDKQGKSVYRLDGKRTTLNEINSLLVELGIDITGHNIVTQGDITKIIEMSAIQRREIIDNIAGLSEFDEKKEEALKELNKVDSRLKEATIILSERNNFLDEMEKDMNAAKEHAELEKERKQIKATIISKELYIIDKRLFEIEKETKENIDKKEEIEKNVEFLKIKLEQTKISAKELNEKALKGNEEIYEKIGRDFEERKSNFYLEKERIEIKNNQIEKNNLKIKNNTEMVNNSEKEVIELEENVNNLNQQKIKIDEKIQGLSYEKTELEKIVETKNSQIKEIEFGLDENNKLIENFRKELFDLEVFVKQWEKQKTNNTKMLNESINEKQLLEKKLDELLKNEKEMKELNGKKIEETIIQKENLLELIRNKKSVLTAQIDEEKKAINELEKEITKCPVCESDIKKERKTILLSQKKEIIIQKEIEIKKQVDATNIILNELDDLKEKLKIYNKLALKIEEIGETKSKINDFDKKIKLIEIELNQKTVDLQINKRNELSNKMNNLLNEKEKLKEKLKILRNENIFENYSSTIKKQDELIHNKSFLESKLLETNTRLNKISSRNESILIENEELEGEIKQNLEEIQNKKPALLQIETELISKEKEMNAAKKANEAILKEKNELELKIERIEKEIYLDNIKNKKLESYINEFNIENSRLDVRKKDLDDEFKEFENIEIINEKSIEDLKERIVIVNKKIEGIGAVNMKAVENFTELKKEVDEMQEKSSKLETERLCVLDMIDKIDVKRTNVFMDCFNEVNKNFQEMFSKFFNGEGVLDLTNPTNPLESGLIIDAKPKGGKLQNIDSMSGGEKTLTALAFMFAIQLYSPAPFYAFDEADAALDKENSMKMGSLIEMIAKNSQFIAITHNDTITKKATQIVGVALNKDQSSVIGLKLKNNQNDNNKPINENEEITKNNTRELNSNDEEPTNDDKKQ